MFHQWFIIEKCQRYLYHLQRQRILIKDKHDACPLLRMLATDDMRFSSLELVKMVLGYKPMTDFFHNKHILYYTLSENAF